MKINKKPDSLWLLAVLFCMGLMFSAITEGDDDTPVRYAHASGADNYQHVDSYYK